MAPHARGIHPAGRRGVPEGGVALRAPDGAFGSRGPRRIGPVAHGRASPPLENREARGLFLRCAEGEEGAWDLFLRQYKPLLALLVRRTLSRGGVVHSAEVEDCLGEVFASLLRERGAKFRRYDPTFRPVTWLVLVVQTVVLNRMRRERRVPAPFPLERLAVRLLSEEGDPVERTMGKESTEALRAAMEALTPRERLVLRLTYEDGCRNREVAAILRVSETTISSMLSVCREKLRRRLQREIF